MVLERALERLSICTSRSQLAHCPHARTFATSSRWSAQQRSATSAFADTLEANSEANRMRKSQQNAKQGRQSTALEFAKQSIQNTTATMRRRAAQDEELSESMIRQDYETQMRRRWQAGDVYAPHDLSGVEMGKWKVMRRRPRAKKVPGGGDVIDQLGINPLEHYKNFAIMGEFMTDIGRIKSSTDTGLRPVNQRRMAKAIRRAVGIGLMPSVHRHPEILRSQLMRARVI